MKTVKVNPIDLSDIYLVISHKSNKHNNDPLFQQFMLRLNGLISSKTKLNYNTLPVINNMIFIPIQPYSVDEMKMSIDELINIRKTELINFLANIDWNVLNKNFIWCVRTLMNKGINIFNDLELVIRDKNMEIDQTIRDIIPIKIKKCEFDEIKINRVVADDGSMVTIITDPISSDFGLFVDFSVFYEEMGFASNTLHLYEHILTKMWKKLNGNNVKEMNGSTYNTGISYVYTVHGSFKSFREHTNASIDWILKSRDPKFWDNEEIKKDIEFETIRTISETTNRRSMIVMGRSDPKAYSFGYDIDIFKYWANKPFNILVVVQAETDWPLTTEKLNELIKKYPLQKVKKPPLIQLDNIPIEVLRIKHRENIKTKKMNPIDIKNIMMSSKRISNSIYGLDVCITYNNEEEEVSKCMPILYPLLFFTKFTTIDEQREYMKKVAIPYSSSLYNAIPALIKYNQRDLEYYLPEMD